MAYVWLLSDALKDRESEPAPTSTLVEELLASSQYLRDCNTSHDVEGVLAANLAYDRALMGVASALGCATAPSRFSDLSERERLEERLDALGLNVARLAIFSRSPKLGRNWSG